MAMHCIGLSAPRVSGDLYLRPGGSSIVKNKSVFPNAFAFEVHKFKLYDLHVIHEMNYISNQELFIYPGKTSLQ